MKPTDVTQLLEDLHGGVFKEQIARALSQVGAAVVDHGRAGKVTITFDLKRIAKSSQVQCSHKLNYVEPTSLGEINEKSAAETPLYVNSGGELSLFPLNQGQMFDRDGSAGEHYPGTRHQQPNHDQE